MAPTSRVLILRLSNVCIRTVWSFDADCVIPDRLAIQILKSASTALIFANIAKITEIKQNEGVIVNKYWRYLSGYSKQLKTTRVNIITVGSLYFLLRLLVIRSSYEITFAAMADANPDVHDCLMRRTGMHVMDVGFPFAGRLW